MKTVFRLLATGTSLFATTFGALATPARIPEPDSIWLVGIALGAAAWVVLRKKK